MKRLQRMFRWANVILIFLTFFAYLSPYLHPSNFGLISFLGLLYPVLLMLNLLFVAFWLWQGKRYALLSFACIVLGWSHFTSFVGLPFGSQSVEVEQNHIKVLSYNVHSFFNQLKSDSTRRWTAEHLTNFYHQHEADVWCLQEFPIVPKYADRYFSLIKEKTPLKYVYHQNDKGLVIFSRFPLNKISTHYFGNSANGYMIADLKKGGQKIRIFNIHLQSNAVSQLANKVAADGKIQEKETWLQIKGMLGRYRRAAIKRTEQAKEIREQLEKSPYPSILCGDFNDVPLSYTYRTLAAGLLDGFQKKGKGMGTTFRGSLPALRIDYVFSSPELPPLGYLVLPTQRSDHFPVLSVLQLAEYQKK